MTNQTIEQAVEEIVNKASDCAYGMNLDISGKESKRMMDEFSRSTWFKGELTQALQAQRDAGAEEERKRIEEQFPDYAHTRYLGCYAEGGIWHYSYDTEVIHLFADFLTPPTK